MRKRNEKKPGLTSVSPKNLYFCYKILFPPPQDGSEEKLEQKKIKVETMLERVGKTLLARWK